MRPRALSIVGALVAGLWLAAGLAIIAPTVAGADTIAATPTCPAQAVYNAATGNCERPAIAECPAGAQISGTQCAAPSSCKPGSTPPDRGTCTDPGAPGGPLMYRVSCPGGMEAIGNSSTCTSVPRFVCPTGQTLSGATCSSPPTWTCPAGYSLSGRQCVSAPKPAEPVAAPAPPKPAGDAKPAASSGGGGLKLAATGQTTTVAVGIAGLALVLGGVLMLSGLPGLARRTRPSPSP